MKLLIATFCFIGLALMAATMFRDPNKDVSGIDYGMTPMNSPSVGDVLTVTSVGTLWTNTVIRVWSGTSGGIVVPVGSPVYMPPNNSAASLPTSDIAGATRCPVTRATILQNFYVVVSLAPGASKTNSFTLMTNGVASSLVVSISGSATSGNDTTHSISIPSGAEIGVKVTTASGSVAGKASWSFEGR